MNDLQLELEPFLLTCLQHVPLLVEGGREQAHHARRSTHNAETVWLHGKVVPEEEERGEGQSALLQHLFAVRVRLLVLLLYRVNACCQCLRGSRMEWRKATECFRDTRMHLGRGCKLKMIASTHP